MKFASNKLVLKIVNDLFKQVTLKRPVKFFAEVKLNEVPVLDARVRVKVDVVNLSGQKTDGVWVELLDNGNGGTEI